MDENRCPGCHRRLIAVLSSNGRTELQCLVCDEVDPLRTDALNWAESPLSSPTEAASAPARAVSPRSPWTI
jgi:hypothetical protein